MAFRLQTKAHMTKYPAIVRVRLDPKSGALLLHHAKARGTSEGELARELLVGGLDRLDNEATTPLWLELFVLENFRLRAAVLKLCELAGEQLGWSRDRIIDTLEAT